MKPSIIFKLKALHKRYKEIRKLLNSEIVTDQIHISALLKEYAQLSDISRCFSSWEQNQHHIKIAQQMLNDLEMREIAQEELQNAMIRANTIEKELKILLLPKNQDDKYNVFIEIHAGTGGSEAALFASDLFRMYSRYADLRQWSVEILSINNSEHGGYREIIAKISGKEVYKYLKFESGGHRVQRIPSTESQGRIHTSTCTVAVIPEFPKEKSLNINPADIRIDTFRSSGAGGQHVNTTDSAIRITHLPTNIVVVCQDERSQHKNKAKAMSILNARIQAKEMEKRQRTETSIRRNLLGNGDRNDRNRTYNFPQRRITDHRINLTIYRLNEVMEGNLDIIIKPIIQEYQASLLEELDW